MKKRLLVKLLPGWADHSDKCPHSPTTYLRDTSTNPGPLQISLNRYIGGAIPNPSQEDLIKLAIKIGDTLKATELVDTMSGNCTFGNYGSAVFHSSNYPRMQVWVLSNGYDFILATHICIEGFEQREIEEADDIVKEISLKKRPWWKLW